jgi:hypothetical protein
MFVFTKKVSIFALLIILVEDFKKSNFYTPEDIVKIINEYGDN